MKVKVEFTLDLPDDTKEDDIPAIISNVFFANSMSKTIQDAKETLVITPESQNIFPLL
jgi:hypothetical protein